MESRAQRGKCFGLKHVSCRPVSFLQRGLQVPRLFLPGLVRGSWLSQALEQEGRLPAQGSSVSRRRDTHLTRKSC